MKIAAIIVAAAQALAIDDMMQMTKDAIAEYAPTPGNGSFIKCSKPRVFILTFTKIWNLSRLDFRIILT